MLRNTPRGRASALALACVLTMLPLTSALAHPGSAIVVDRLGQVWFLDTGDGLWKIDRSGRLIRMGGDRFHWMTIDPDNLFAKTTLPSRDIGRVGTNPTLLIASDFPIALGVDGNLYFPSHDRDGRVQIMRTLPSGATSVLATLPATLSGAEPLRYLNGLTGGEDGALYFTENKAIRRITMQGRVSTVAADVHAPSCAAIPGNPGSDRPFLRGLAVDARGVMYVAASGCGSVLKITPDGRASTLVQTQSPWSPTAVALFGADVYVLEYLHTEIEDRRAWIPRVRKISPDGKSVVVATVARR